MPTVTPELDPKESFGSPLDEPLNEAPQAPGVRDYLEQLGKSFDDGTPEAVKAQPNQAAGQQPGAQGPSQAPNLDPSQVTGPNTLQPGQRLTGDQAARRLTANADGAPGFSRKETGALGSSPTATPTTGNKLVDGFNKVKGIFGKKKSDKPEEPPSKIADAKETVKKDGKDALKLAASGGTDVRAWISVGKRHAKWIFYPALVGCFFALLLGSGVGDLLGINSGDSGGTVGVPGTSPYAQSASNPEGIWLNIMTDRLNINDPKTKKPLASITMEATSGGFSDERDAQRATADNSAGINGDNGRPIAGRACLFEGGKWISDNGRSGIDCLASGVHYDLTTKQRRPMSDEELRWYVTARWPYVKTYWWDQKFNRSPKTVSNPAQPSKYFFGRKVVLYNPATNKAAVGMVSEWGPAPWTGIRKNDVGPQRAAWQNGPDGPEPRVQVPAGYMGRVAGGGTAFSEYLGASTDTPIVVGFLNADLQDSTPLGPISGFTVSKTRPDANRSGKVPLYKQANYANVPYPGSSSTASTISTSGCGITSAAMVLAYYGRGANEPLALIRDLANFALNNGSPRYRRMGHLGTDYRFFPAIAQREGLKFEDLGTNWDKIVAHLRQDHPVIVSGKGAAPFTAGGHFVVLVGITAEGSVQVNDPGRRRMNFTQTYSPETIRSGMTTARTLYE